MTYVVFKIKCRYRKGVIRAIILGLGRQLRKLMRWNKEPVNPLGVVEQGVHVSDRIGADPQSSSANPHHGALWSQTYQISTLLFKSPTARSHQVESWGYSPSQQARTFSN